MAWFAAVSAATTPDLKSVAYPNGRLVHYNYPAEGIGAALVRVDNLAADDAGDGNYAQLSSSPKR